MNTNFNTENDNVLSPSNVSILTTRFVFKTIMITIWKIFLFLWKILLNIIPIFCSIIFYLYNFLLQSFNDVLKKTRDLEDKFSNMNKKCSCDRYSSDIDSINVAFADFSNKTNENSLHIIANKLLFDNFVNNNTFEIFSNRIFDIMNKNKIAKKMNALTGEFDHAKSEITLNVFEIVTDFKRQASNIGRFALTLTLILTSQPLGLINTNNNFSIKNENISNVYSHNFPGSVDVAMKKNVRILASELLNLKAIDIYKENQDLYRKTHSLFLNRNSCFEDKFTCINKEDRYIYYKEYELIKLKPLNLMNTMSEMYYFERKELVAKLLTFTKKLVEKSENEIFNDFLKSFLEGYFQPITNFWSSVKLLYGFLSGRKIRETKEKLHMLLTNLENNIESENKKRIRIEPIIYMLFNKIPNKNEMSSSNGVEINVDDFSNELKTSYFHFLTPSFEKEIRFAFDKNKNNIDLIFKGFVKKKLFSKEEIIELFQTNEYRYLVEYISLVYILIFSFNSYDIDNKIPLLYGEKSLSLFISYLNSVNLHKIEIMLKLNNRKTLKKIPESIKKNYKIENSQLERILLINSNIYEIK